MLRALCVSVPPEDVAGVRDLLDTLRAVKEDSAAEGSADLAVLHELIRDADAHGGGPTPLELCGPPGLIRDAVYGLLLDGADALADACRSYEAGSSSLPELMAAGESAARRLELMKRVEEADGWSGD